jgi:hypothetical protein
MTGFCMGFESAKTQRNIRTAKSEGRGTLQRNACRLEAGATESKSWSCLVIGFCGDLGKASRLKA